MDISQVPIEWLIYCDTLDIRIRRDERENYDGKNYSI